MVSGPICERFGVPPTPQMVRHTNLLGARAMSDIEGMNRLVADKPLGRTLTRCRHDRPFNDLCPEP